MVIMGTSRNGYSTLLDAQEGMAEEFAAAIEAATGEEFPSPWGDPMSGADVREALEKLLLLESCPHFSQNHCSQILW